MKLEPRDLLDEVLPEEASVSAHPGEKPSGTATVRKTQTVTVQAIDMAIPAVTVKTEDGTTVSFRLKKKKNLEGVKVGDLVIITNTQALMIEVTEGK